MTITTGSLAVNYVDQVLNVPDSYEEFQQVFNFSYRRMAQAINDRDIARYDCVDLGTPTPPGFERATGQQWFGANPQTTRLAFRKIVQFPALIVGANNAPHFLGTITGYTFTQIRCVLQDPVTPVYAPLSNDGGGNFIQVGAANVTITLPGASPWVGYTAIVLLEYLKA
jgi:hypothetical protein